MKEREGKGAGRKELRGERKRKEKGGEGERIGGGRYGG